jgi:hypothetical protein
MINNGEGSQVVSPVRLSYYIGLRKPILACVPDGASKQFLRGYDAVRISAPDEPGDIADLIIEYYELFKKNRMPTANEDEVRKFDLELLTAQLTRYFEFLRYIPHEFDIRGNSDIQVLGRDDVTNSE